MSRKFHCLPCVLACLLAALALPARADSDHYALDPVHTRILVAVDHAGFSRALGTLSGASGTLEFDPDDWSGARVQVEIPLARLDFGDAKWNRATLARGLLDAAAYPLASFTSTRVEPLDAQRAVVHGTLSLHGVEREVALQVVLNAAKRHPLPPFRRTVGFSATATLSRAEFGITAWKSVIGDAVELRIEAEATRVRDPGDASRAADEDSPADHIQPGSPDVPPASGPPSESSPSPDPEPLP